MPWAGNIAKTMTSNRKQFTVTREMLTAVVRHLSITWLFVFHRFQFDPFALLYNKSRISMFPSTSSRETLRFSGNKIHCSPRDKSVFNVLSLFHRCYELKVKSASTKSYSNSWEKYINFAHSQNYYDLVWYRDHAWKWVKSAHSRLTRAPIFDLKNQWNVCTRKKYVTNIFFSRFSSFGLPYWMGWVWQFLLQNDDQLRIFKKA